MKDQIHTKICVVGAGPGGVIASMFIAKENISSLLLDKDVFPRDKICGDALSNKVAVVLNQLDTGILEELSREKFQMGSWGAKIIAPNLGEFKLPTLNDANKNEEPLGFTSKRYDFDNFLISQVEKQKSIHKIEGCKVNFYQPTQNGWILKPVGKNIEIHAKLLIIADGANSYFARHIANIDVEPKHYYAGLRCYYRGVTSIDPYHNIELHFLKEFLPGYFWIISLPNGLTNVGIGIRSDIISKRRINLKTMFFRVIEEYPTLRKRFRNAELIEGPRGWGLPMGSKNRKISGFHYLLVGDAASLINPFTSEGIGNAMRSGMLAAQQAVKCIQEDNFSQSFIKGYEKKVHKELGNELNFSSQLQRLANHPAIFNFIVSKASKSKLFSETISFMLANSQIRHRLRNPIFYLKLLFGY